MAQWVQTLAAKSDNIRSIPRTGLFETSDLCPCSVAHMRTCKQTHTHTGSYKGPRFPALALGGSQLPVIPGPGKPTPSGLPGHLHVHGAHTFMQAHTYK